MKRRRALDRGGVAESGSCGGCAEGGGDTNDG